MNEKLLKRKIIKFCRKFIKLQYLYDDIFENSKNHLPFPDTIQKEIIIRYTNMGLAKNNNKTIDFINNDTQMLYELKSTTTIDGSVVISDEQAEYANYLIWMYIDCMDHKIYIKYMGLDDQNIRNHIKGFVKPRSFVINKVFEKYAHEEIIINMYNLKIEKANYVKKIN